MAGPSRRTRSIARALVPALLLALVAAAGARGAGQTFTMPPPDPPDYDNPVIAADFPDASAIRIGPEYWAVATATKGHPSPPILRSRDLVHWTHAGYLLTEPPEWSTGTQMWGPWLERFGDRYLVYYSARRKYGRPCVTVGESLDPIGPYTDHGPLVCQSNASIDPSVYWNPHGRPFLVWKENGWHEPSSIWTQPLSRDGLRLQGSPRRIMTGIRHSWEGGLVEGARVVRRRGWLYMFYSGGRCCAPSTCRYALGVARSRSLYGPWRRYRRNPILKSDSRWKCPGHGAILQTPSGHWWMLYNGYRARGSTHRGREMLLDLVRWSRKGWPYITRGYRPAPIEPPADGGTQPADGGAAPASR